MTSSDILKASNALILQLVPDYIQNLEAYQSARRIGGKGRYWLNANELANSPLGHLHTSELNRYPDFLPDQLAQTYATYAKLPAEYCLATRGADEAIELLTRCYSHAHGKHVVISSPSYGMYQFCAQANNSKLYDIPLKNSFSWDIDALISQAQNSSIIFICSPNNPSGNAIEKHELERLLSHTHDHCLVVVDEAYLEFCPQQEFVELLNNYPNLMLIRTLSKAFGLASLRVGFLLANPILLQTVRKLIAPYPIPDPSAQIAIQALSSLNLSTVQDSTYCLNRRRDQFSHQLSNIACVEKVFPSSTNFVLVRVKQPSPNHCFSFLREQQIVARNQSHEPSLANCIRISIGQQHELDAVIAAFQKYNQNQSN
ncbi:histidinol-phosphate transaminase [Alginatibacterium sediminis]|uniref:Histidinol-phosphate aminotransferase n=1 Tax=Alginatibacterium sediminis TaxID=2164068 RepID=A0A420E7C2_9ALTE|nr:histidinol-phosphate transaminase [Alginatibacterium sediminis]RKF13632.1 histidinol-phosphate transaminase [Alginatibacterium sediminis]